MMQVALKWSAPALGLSSDPSTEKNLNLRD